MLDAIHEECGIVGAYHPSQDVQPLVTMSLHALQHRGQESAGIAVSNGRQLRNYRKLGLVSDLARKVRALKNFKGHIAIGHTRYSTTGNTSLVNSQPILIDYKMGQLAVAHNGNLVNAKRLRRQLENRGAIFQSTNDSEVILHLMAHSRKRNVPDMVIDTLNRVRGAYSLVFLSEDNLIAVRDSYGVRPLCLGKLNKAFIVASETCAFDIIGAEYIRDIEPGEALVCNGKGLCSYRLNGNFKKAQCIFEYIYFSRPDSRIFGHSVDRLRRFFGRQLAEEHPADADMIISVPDSSNTAALGFSQASDIPFEIGLIRNHYVGRTFISPIQNDREAKVKLKFNPVRGVLKNKRIVVVEDSIVRGTTLKQLVKVLRAAGAREIHVRVSSPPIKYPCFYGMDFPSREELVANNKTLEQTRAYLGVESLGHLSLKGLRKCMKTEAGDYCYGCFAGRYPLKRNYSTNKDIFEKKQK